VRLLVVTTGKRTGVGQMTFLPPDGVLDQQGGAQSGVEGAARNRSRIHRVSCLAE